MTKLTEKKETVLIGAAYFLAFLLGVETGGLQYSVLKIANEFHLSNAEMGSIISVYFFATMISPLITGILSDKIGKKKVIICSLCIFIAGCLVSSAAAGMKLVYIGVFIMGLAFAALESSSTAALSDCFPEKSGKYISIMQSILSAGCLLSPIILYYFMYGRGFSWRILFIICAILALLSLILVVSSEFKGDSKFIKNDISESGDRLKAEPYMILMVCCIAIYLFTENGITYFADMFISVELKSPDAATLALSLFWAAMTVSRFISGLLYKFEDAIIKLGFGLTAFLLISMSLTDCVSIALAVYFLMGITCAPIWPVIAGKLNRKYNKHTGFITGLVLIAGGIGGSVSPYIIGLISDAAGMKSAFIMLAGFAVIGVVIIFTCSVQKYSIRK